MSEIHMEHSRSYAELQQIPSWDFFHKLNGVEKQPPDDRRLLFY